jgi:hypothetical protein
MTSGSQRIGHLGDGDDLGPGRQQLLEFLDEKVAILIDGRPLEHDTVPLAVEMPGHDVGVMLHDGEHHFVARLQHHAAIALRHEVDGLGGVAGENDLLHRGRVEEAPDTLARILESLGRGVGEEVQAAVDVGIFFRVGLGHRIEHGLRLLRRGRIVEIDQLLAIDLTREDGEVRADGLHVITHQPPLRCSISQRAA